MVTAATMPAMYICMRYISAVKSIDLVRINAVHSSAHVCTAVMYVSLRGISLSWKQKFVPSQPSLVFVGLSLVLAKQSAWRHSRPSPET